MEAPVSLVFESYPTGKNSLKGEFSQNDLPRFLNYNYHQINTYMKPGLRKIPNPNSPLFSVQAYNQPHFFTLWHTHPENELVLILEGAGTLLVGDSREKFGAGYLLLIGADLPHIWRNDVAYHSLKAGKAARSIVIHFRNDLLTSSFSTTAPVKSLGELLERAKRGIRLTGSTLELVSQRMDEISRAEKPDRLLLLLAILRLIDETTEFELLAGHDCTRAYNKVDAHRMTQVYEYVFSHFSHPITLKNIADHVQIRPNLFNKYFANRAKKTFSQFVVEVQISKACELLLNSTMRVGQIGFQCGFQNLTGFNQHFKKQMGFTPTLYRKTYAGGQPAEKPVLTL